MEYTLLKIGSISEYFFTFDAEMSYLNSKSRQNAAYGTVAKSLPQNRVILPKPFV